MDAKVIRFSPDGPGGRGLGEQRPLVTPGLLTLPPLERELVLYRDPSGRFTTGVWECEAYEEVYESYPQDEFMHVLEGSVTVIDAHGHQETFRAGDSFFIERGFKGTWRQPERMKKYFAILLAG
ncbi:MAG TPA: cupin domain-containing protein [Mesorhizobium sp.]|jgi:hypothetical protein|nr:cupin domain-containing protein [Mesorhizobium sp.]